MQEQRTTDTVGATPASVDSLDSRAVSDAIEQLERSSPLAAEVVRHLYFLGFGVDETAALLGVTAETVEDEWTRATAWFLASP